MIGYNAQEAAVGASPVDPGMRHHVGERCAMTARQRVRRPFCALWLGLGLCASSQATTFSIKPVTLNPTCVAGTNLGEACARDSDCDTNPGSGDGLCEGTPITFTCTGGANPGAPCGSSLDCSGGVCGPDEMHELAYLPRCYSIDSENPVPNDGQPCDDIADCESVEGACDAFCLGDYEIDLFPGDVVVTEIYASDWSPNGAYPDEACRIWQVDIDEYSFMNGICDPDGVFPVCRLDMPPDPIPCTTRADCPPPYPICNPNRLCVGPDHLTIDCLFIDSARSDYIFHGLLELPAVDYGEWRAGSAALGAEQMYTPPPKYLATMVLGVSDGACGDFTIPFALGGLGTCMMNAFYERLGPFVAENLVVHAGPAPYPPCILVGNCAIDAGQPHPPDGSSSAGSDSMVLHCRPYVDLSSLTVDDFTLRRIPADPVSPPPPEIESLYVENVQKVVVIHLDRPIDPGNNGRWTCIEWLSLGDEFCLGYLPGDVTNDRVAAQNDIGVLIDYLVDPALHPLELYQCDINRSGACTPADLLRLIDVFAGGDAYAPGWEGGSLISCPSNQPVPTTKRSHPIRRPDNTRRMGH